MFRYNQTKYRGRWSQNVLLNRPTSTAEPVTASGHARRQNFCTAQTTAATSLDHLVGAGEQCGRNVEPSALAVLRLRISSNLVGCRNGKSAGLAPRRMRPT